MREGPDQVSYLDRCVEISFAHKLDRMHHEMFSDRKILLLVDVTMISCCVRNAASGHNYVFLSPKKYQNILACNLQYKIHPLGASHSLYLRMRKRSRFCTILKINGWYNHWQLYRTLDLLSPLFLTFLATLITRS